MNRRTAFAFLGASLVAEPVRAASFPLQLFSRHISRRHLLIAGSTTMSELIDALVAGFVKSYPDVDVVTEAASSLSAVIALRHGSIDVAAMNRDLREEEDEKGIRNYLVARTGIDVVVSRDSAITSLTSQQASGILRGEISDWSQIGASRASIQLLAGAPSRRLLEEGVLPDGNMPDTSRLFKTPQDAAKAVAGDPHAIGFVVHGEKWDDDIRRLPVDGVDASQATLLSNRYPFTQSLYVVVKDEDPQSPACQFVDFARSDVGKKIINSFQLIATS